MRLIIFAFMLLYPITAYAEEQKPWYQYQEQVSKESDKKIKSFAQILKELERKIEQRYRRQQRAPQYPTKK